MLVLRGSPNASGSPPPSVKGPRAKPTDLRVSDASRGAATAYGDTGLFPRPDPSRGSRRELQVSASVRLNAEPAVRPSSSSPSYSRRPAIQNRPVIVTLNRHHFDLWTRPGLAAKQSSILRPREAALESMDAESFQRSSWTIRNRAPVTTFYN